MTPGDAAAGRVRVRPTGELWQHLGFPALFATLALELRQDLVFLLGALVVGCALCAAPLCRRNLQGLLLTRRAPRRARAGVASAVVYELTNTRRRPAIGVEIQEARPRGALPALARLEAECVGAGRHVNARCAVTFARRGM